MKESDRYTLNLAKAFATAYIANQMGVTFKTAQGYVSKEQAGEFWIALAQMVIKHMQESQSNWFKKVDL